MDQWTDRVRKYNERNAGRVVTMDLIRNDLMPMPEARRMVLSGVDYDQKAKRVDIMLGRGDEHLHHSIDDVNSIHLLMRADSSGDVLTIEHRGGQTVLADF